MSKAGGASVAAATMIKPYRSYASPMTGALFATIVLGCSGDGTQSNAALEATVTASSVAASGSGTTSGITASSGDATSTSSAASGPNTSSSVGSSGAGGATGAGGAASTSPSAATSATTTAGTTTTTTSSSTGAGGGDTPAHLPQATGTCPAMSKLDGSTVTFAGQDATVWSGDPASGPGPLLIYYFASGSGSIEAFITMGSAQIDKIKSLGGAIVAQKATTAKGTTTGNNVWYTGDADIADEIVACAIQNQKIDPRRIHVAGYSAGALQATYMWFARSGYVASVLTYSGGDDVINKAPLQDPAHPPAALVTHGAQGKDTFGGVIDFAETSATWESDIKQANGFAIDCDDGGAHSDFMLRTKVAPQALQFFLDHAYGAQPYTQLPPGWPSYCSIK